MSHTLQVALDPERGSLRVSDVIDIGHPVDTVEFVLNAGLAPSSNDGTIDLIATSSDGLRSAYRITLETTARQFELHYHGQPVFSDTARAVGAMPQGIVSPHAIYLDGASAWYAQFNRPIDALQLSVSAPSGWLTVSNGTRSETQDAVIWRSVQPQDEIYLIAGRFTRHARTHGDIILSAYLLDHDPQLAARYLDAMGGYIDHYSRMIGDYPYGKFAVVENPWQTGYGMPSFTLLGSRVLRLPFILYTSLPHEILHNWWGNGVWVDYEAGNWSEGLTAYLADHWMQEREAKGDQYRLKALQRYSNFAARGDDLPLLAFVSRHSDASQSIGYSKSLMLFHMLRNSLGDEAFINGLRRLWQRHQFEAIGFEQALRTLLDGDDVLVGHFLPWLQRTGAPALALADVQVTRDGGRWQLRLAIRQTQERPFSFRLPIAITLAGRDVADVRLVDVNDLQTAVSLQLDAQPLRIDIDPAYDVLRILDTSEQPAALNRLFGGVGTRLVLPTAVPDAERAAWQALAKAWQARYPGLEITDDDSAEAGDSGDRIVLGWRNRLVAHAVEAVQRPGQHLDSDGLTIDDSRYAATAHGVVVVGTTADDASVAAIAAPSAEAITVLARKLPHYGSYGRLVFDAAGNNLRKETLPSTRSRLTRQLSTVDAPLRLPPRSTLGGID